MLVEQKRFARIVQSGTYVLVTTIKTANRLPTCYSHPYDKIHVLITKISGQTLSGSD